MPIEMARRPGRPRDPQVDAAIRDAALGLLLEEGYARLSIEGVAERAGVGHSSIYRRWGSKPHMVHELVFPDDLAYDAPAGTPLPDVVHGLAARIVASVSRPEARAALPGLLTDAQADPELRRRLVNRFEPAARELLRRAATEADARGDLRPGADVGLVLDASLGVAIVAEEVDGGALADLLLHGLVG